MTESRPGVLLPRGVAVLRLLNWAQAGFWALSLVQPFLGITALGEELWHLFPPLGIMSLALALSFGSAAGFASSGRTWVWNLGLVASGCGLLYALLLASGMQRATMGATALAALLTFGLSLHAGTRSWFR
ncbi:hypothetical protein [Nonomuraea sp. NPDC050202]|uniref:hypothetical protein n=1 Tax=Nonomuraea sp. NPDC050202 TaxID=3155035 RepID=UPI0033F3835B